MIISDMDEFKAEQEKDFLRHGFSKADAAEVFERGYPFNIEWFKDEGMVTDRGFILYQAVYCGSSKKDAEFLLKTTKEAGQSLEKMTPVFNTF